MSESSSCILIDWFTCTFVERDYSFLLEIMPNGIDWQARKGHYGYKSSFWYGGMWILYEGSDDMGCCLEFSGQGCRQFETCSPDKPLIDFIMECVFDEGGNVTRLDVAYDDIDHNGNGLLDVGKIERLARRDRYISKFGVRSGEWSGKHSDEGEKNPLAFSVYFGSPRSDVRIRIYDKSQERGGLGYHWTRFEIQLRRDAAFNFLDNVKPVGEKYYGVITNYLRFVDKDPHDSNRRRWKSSKWWTDFLGEVARVSVYSKKTVDYNMSRLESYMFHQCGNSIDTYLKCVGSMKFFEMLRERNSELNANQLQLIDDWSKLTEEKRAEYWIKHPYSRF